MKSRLKLAGAWAVVYVAFFMFTVFLALIFPEWMKFGILIVMLSIMDVIRLRRRVVKSTIKLDGLMIEWSSGLVDVEAIIKENERPLNGKEVQNEPEKIS